MDFGLAGRVAIITGGGRGIGLADAHALGAEGAVVVVIELDRVAAECAVAELKANKVDATFYQGDAADESLCERVLEDVGRRLSLIHISKPTRPY